MLYARMISTNADPLMPALQNNLLLTVHVACAIIAYGSFSVAFGAAILFLIQPEGGRWGLPKPELLDEISYRAVVVGFPFLTSPSCSARSGPTWPGHLLELGSEGDRVARNVVHLRDVPPCPRRPRLARQEGRVPAARRVRRHALHLLRHQRDGFGKGSLHSYSGLGN